MSASESFGWFERNVIARSEFKLQPEQEVAVKFLPDLRNSQET